MSLAHPLSFLAHFNPIFVSGLITRAATEHVMRYHRSPELAINLKGDKSLVTQADIETSRFLETELTAHLPGSVIVSEEAEKSHQIQGDLVWIIDPIDGTRPFSSGGVMFAIMVALAFRGQVIRSWIYRPVQKTMLYFDGTVTRLDGRILRFAPSDLSWYGSLQARHTPLTYPLPQKKHKYVTQHSVANAEAFKLALELTDFFMCDNVTPWDTAAPAGIHLGMGGVIAYADGQPYDLGRTQKPLIFAKDQVQFAQLAEFAREVYQSPA